jgi:DNA-binding NarL/FixJ family response regulator
MVAKKTVLSVGQCRPDSAAIAHFLKSHFDAEVLTADLPEQAFASLERNTVDLVLINRILDTDGSEGLEILKQIRSGTSQNEVPVMLVSNHPEWQQKAVELGARYGFGKAELNRPDTSERLAEILEER